jgi:hypothetical protein
MTFTSTSIEPADLNSSSASGSWGEEGMCELIQSMGGTSEVRTGSPLNSRGYKSKDSQPVSLNNP